MFLNKYKLENLAKHNLNNDITSNSNLEFIKDKIKKYIQKIKIF